MITFKKRLFKGFTLIELIFVIAIIGVIITLGVSYTSKFNERAKEKTAALQIQQLLQAGMAYYVANNKWPDPGNTSQNQTVDFVKNYVPAATALQVNPWQSTSSTSSKTLGYAWTYYNPDQLTDQTKGFFQVTTTTPDQNTAERVASLLPNAYYDTTNTSNVVAQVGLPGESAQKSYGYILTVGQFNVAAKSIGITGVVHTCNFSKATLADADYQECTNKGMHAEVISGIQSINPRYTAASGTSIAESWITFQSTCNTTISGSKYYGVAYTLQSNLISSSVAAEYKNKSAISYIVACLPGAVVSGVNSNNKNDIEYGKGVSCPTSNSDSACGLT